MFKFHQKFIPSGCSPIYEPVEERSENGDVITVLKVNQPTLPKPSLFDMEKMIAAGVDLQQVNTKILEGDYSPLVDDLNSFDNKQSTNEKENLNEN